MTLQGIVAVAAGLVAMAAIVMIGSAAAAVAMGRPAAAPGKPTAADLALDYALGMVAALAGGITTAWLAPFAPVRHGIALSAAVLAMAVLCLLAYGDNGPPRWYQAALSLSAAVVALAGAWLAATGA